MQHLIFGVYVALGLTAGVEINRKELFTIIVSCAVTAALLVACDLAHPDRSTSCEDGWRSLSIGSQGACSHHDGVRYGGDTTPWYLVAASFLAGAGTFLALSSLLNTFQAPQTDEREKMILLAVRDSNILEFNYTKRGSTVAEAQRISPKRLIFLAQKLPHTRCVVGYCYRTNDERTFTLSRMSDIRVV